jgi:hypothetical protein
LPIEVVFPVPLTPVISSTDGRWLTSMRGSPSGRINSATMAARRSPSSSAVRRPPASASASSRSITVTVAETPQSA